MRILLSQNKRKPNIQLRKRNWLINLISHDINPSEMISGKYDSGLAKCMRPKPLFDGCIQRNRYHAHAKGSNYVNCIIKLNTIRNCYRRCILSHKKHPRMTLNIRSWCFRMEIIHYRSNMHCQLYNFYYNIFNVFLRLHKFTGDFVSYRELMLCDY